MRGGFEGLAAALRERADAGLLRERRILESAQGTRVRIDGRELLAFCSNDYLGLAAEPRVVKALQDGAARWGVGSGASHLVSGHMQPHHELEERLADFTGRERALLFSSGYAANLGVCCALLARGDAIFEDRLNHASLLDGGLLSGARLQRFLHNDAASLAAKLERTQAVRALVAVDGVFSMDGDIAPLPALARTAAAHGAWLYVDDAHGFGVLGERGAGSLEHCGLGSAEVPLLMATLGKSLGVGGAFVAGDAVAIDTLVQHARTFIYTTAMPPALAVAAIAALDILQSEPWRREHLRALIAHFRAGCATLGLQLPDSPTAIQPVILGTPERALACAEALRREGILVPAIRPPTVPAGSSRLRITLSAAHGMPDVDRLLEALARVIPR